jgi:uncharacterized protein YecT (DUF1311 family)
VSQRNTEEQDELVMRSARMDIRSIGITIAALVGFSVTIGTSPSAAGSVAGDQCAAAATTVGLVVCADGEYRRADQEVNRLYKAILEKLDTRATRLKQPAGAPGGLRARFVFSQRSWVAFRTSDCDVMASLYEGARWRPLLNSTASPHAHPHGSRISPPSSRRSLARWRLRLG